MALRLIRRLFGITGGLLMATGACAGPIVQNQESAYLSILLFKPVGQTFTAEDSKISTIGFLVDNWSQQYQVGYTFRYDLYQGIGVNGPFLGSATVRLPVGFHNYADADFSHLSLTIGNTYTVTISAPDYDWGVAANFTAFDSGEPNPGKIDYLGGAAFVPGLLKPTDDLTFRIIPIPEPSASTLISFSFFLYLFNHAQQRTRHERRGCNHCVPRAGSLSLVRSAFTITPPQYHV